jgi:WD40 repeat protein
MKAGCHLNACFSASRCVCFSFDEAKLAISGPDAVRIYDMNTKDYLFPLATSISTITALHMFNSLIIGGSWDGYINIYSMENGTCLINASLSSLSLRVCLCACHPETDAHPLCVALSGAAVRTLTGHHNPVYCLDRHKDVICSGSSDRTIKVWNPETQSVRPAITLWLTCDAHQRQSTSRNGRRCERHSFRP